jgi:dTMP kinase
MDKKISGKLIVIEGTDGTGKGTQTLLLEKDLAKKGYKVKVFDFPMYHLKSSSVIKKYLAGELGKLDSVSPYQTSILFAMNRFEAVNEIKDYLNLNYIVLANRYTTSNMGHQAGRIAKTKDKNKFLNWLSDFEYNILGVPKPDKVILLHLKPELAQKRVDTKGKRSYLKNKTRDIYEDNLSHLCSAYENYLWIAKKYKWDKVSSAGSVEITFEKIQKLVEKFILTNK